MCRKGLNGARLLALFLDECIRGATNKDGPVINFCFRLHSLSVLLKLVETRLWKHLESPLCS